MSYIIIAAAMNNNFPPRGPYRPMSRGEERFWTVLLSILACLFVGASIWIYADYKDYQEAHIAMQQQWDSGQNRPAAIKVGVGETAQVPAALTAVHEAWDTCGRKSCDDADIRHYPLVFPIGRLKLTDGCYVDESDVAVASIMAISKGVGVYIITFGPDGKTIRLCTQTQHKDDQLVIWSDDPVAVRE